MRKLVLVLVLLGCDALEPTWSEPMGISGVNPWPDATCDDVCGLQGNLCLENSCDGATVQHAADAVPATCEEAIWTIVAEEPSWSGYVSCCCGSN